MMMLDHEKLTDEDRSQIHVNHCLCGAELEAARALADAAEPGEWRYEEDPQHDGFRLRRYSGAPLMKRESFAFAAEARRLVPRLLDGIALLERAVRRAWTDARTAKRELSEERQRHAATIARQAEGKAGPEHDLDLLARYMALELTGDVGLAGELPERRATDGTASRVRRLLARWAGGASIADELTSDTMDRALLKIEERARFRLKEEEETAELRRQLREAIEKVARGEVPEVLRPALREAKKRAKAGG